MDGPPGPPSRAAPTFYAPPAPVVCLQGVLEQTLEKLSLVTSLKSWREGEEESSTVHKSLDANRRIREQFAAVMEQRARQGDDDGSGRVVLSPDARRARAGSTSALAAEYRAVRRRLDSSIGVDSQKTMQAFATRLRGETSGLARTLEHALNELVARGDCPMLRGVVEERTAAEAEREELEKRAAVLRGELAELEERTDRMRAAGDAEAVRTRAEIARLKRRLELERNNAVVATRLHADEQRARLNTQRREHADEQREAAAALEALERELEREQQGFEHTRGYLERKAARAEAELAAWGERYDGEVSAAAAGLEDLTARRESTLTRLEETELRFREEDAAKRARDAVELELRLRREQVAAVAALKIQCAYKCHLARAEVARRRAARGEEAGAGKSGGGKKGKKKKKKK